MIWCHPTLYLTCILHTAYYFRSRTAPPNQYYYNRLTLELFFWCSFECHAVDLHPDKGRITLGHGFNVKIVVLTGEHLGPLPPPALSFARPRYPSSIVNSIQTEGIALAQAADLPADKLLAVLDQGAMSNPMFRMKASVVTIAPLRTCIHALVVACF